MRRHVRTTAIAGCAVGILLVAAGAAWWFRVPLFGLLPARPVVITQTDGGKIVNLAVGQRLEVRLPSNPSSHTAWRATMPLDFLPQEGESSFEASGSPTTRGAGTQAFMFRATRPGSGPLFLGLLPTNDRNSYQPTTTFSIVVVVR